MRTLLVLPLLGLAACANVRPAGPSDYDRVNAWAAAHEPVLLRFDGDVEVRARAIRIGLDSTAFFDQRRERTVTTRTSELHTLEVSDPQRGRLVGAGVGVATGLAMGGAMALPFNNASGDWSTRRKVGTTLIFGVAGGVLGYLVGERTGVRSGFVLR
ncbi:MAG: hypothetical protein LCH53_14125 [Bacteroidetes bacterium]|nr:hypothetical protein [Bacteroidota bacterium]